MTKAYVLLKIRPGMDRQVLGKIRKLDEVETVETLYGEYDMLIKINMKTLVDLDSFIFDTVRTIDGVMSTTTLITMKVPGD